MATYLTRTPSSSGSNTTWTFSCWYKKTSLGLDTVPWATGYTSPQIDESMINIGADDQLRFNIAINDTTDVTVKSSRKLRDVSAWYHIVVACDTTQGTASNRIKFYINGELETNLSNTDYPTQGQSTFFGDTNKAQLIGRQPRTSNYLFGSMSHVHFIDGTAYTPSAFGETDTTTGEWKAKTSPSVTYGTNGFLILKDGNTITDQSSNSNDFTLGGGTLTDLKDNPDNVFATLNPLIKATGGTPTFGNGNTTYKSTNSGWDSGLSTIMPSSGKWYFEVKPMDNDNTMIGLVDIQRNSEFASGTSTYGYLGYKGMSYQSSSGGTGVVYRDNSNAYTSLAGWSAGNICGVAIDLDNQEMFLHINGTYTNSGNPATRANPYDFSSVVNSGNNVAMGVSSRNNYITYVNFGNGYFLTTAVSSAGTNASGNGIFEYDVPTGYTALSTKGLNL
jgi:hypothetical protein